MPTKTKTNRKKPSRSGHRPDGMHMSPAPRRNPTCQVQNAGIHDIKKAVFSVLVPLW